MEIQDLLSKSDELQHEIEGMRPIKPELEHRIMEKFRLDWNYHSNAIEGNVLTLGETRALILEGLTANGKPLKDHSDIRGHDAVIKFLELFVAKKAELTESDIRGIHKILLHEPYQVEARTPEGGTTSKWVKLGEYKTEPNEVKTRTGEYKRFSLPEETPAKMHALMEWFRKESAEKSLHPVLIASRFHHEFTRIHPFDDGNGRMARILMNLILMQNGLFPVVIKIADRDTYIAALSKADAGEFKDLDVLIANEEIHSQEIFLKGAQGQDISDDDDIDKKILLLKKELQNRGKPFSVNGEIQKEFIGKTILPLILRVHSKVKQFDDFFVSHQIHLVGNYFSVVPPEFHSHLTLNLRNISEASFAEVVETINQGNNFKKISVTLQWMSFQLAGTSRFDYKIYIQFFFEKDHYRITASPLLGSVIEVKGSYRVSPDESEIRKIINGLTDAFITTMRDKTK